MSFLSGLLRFRFRSRGLVCQQVVELVTDYLEGALSRRSTAGSKRTSRLPALHGVPRPDAGDNPAGQRLAPEDLTPRCAPT